MSATAVTPTTIEIDAQTRERLKRLAEARNCTPHWLLLEAIRQFLEREEKREEFRQGAIQAWEGGEHATAEEVEAWLAGWESEEEIAAHGGEALLKALDDPPPPNARLLATLRDYAARRNDQTGTIDWSPRPKPL